MLPEKSRIEEIIKIHNELQKLYYSGFDRAIRLGELLEEQKKDSGHGEFENWVKDNLPFSARTARNYRMVFKNREFLKRKVVSDLDHAYLLLKKSQMDLKIERREEIKKEGEFFKHRKEHPEECPPVGKVRYEKSPAGFNLKISVTGEINGLPIIKPECFDPEYIRLEKGKASYDLSQGLREATGDLKRALNNLKRVYKKYGNRIYTAYSFDWNKGQEFLYPELVIAYQEVINKADFYLKERGKLKE